VLPPPENFLKFYAEIINFRAKFSLGYKMHPVIRGRDGSPPRFPAEFVNEQCKLLFLPSSFRNHAVEAVGLG